MIRSSLGEDRDGQRQVHDIPHWIVLGCYTAISLGTLIGGWRIVKTMGSKITKMTPFDGVAAECRSYSAVRNRGIRYTCKHHPYNNGCNHGNRTHKEGDRSQMGCNNQPALCLDTYNTGINASCRRTLLPSFGNHGYQLNGLRLLTWDYQFRWCPGQYRTLIQSPLQIREWSCEDQTQLFRFLPS
jgi:hypothetical protein